MFRRQRRPSQMRRQALQPVALFVDGRTLHPQEVTNCAICTEECKEDTHTIPECQHTFHSSCLIAWFRTGQSSCPMCRGQQHQAYPRNTSLLQMVTRYAKRKTAPVAVKRMYKKYTDANTAYKEIKAARQAFKREHAQLFRQWEAMRTREYRAHTKFRNAKYDLMSIPIIPVRVDVT